MTEKLLTRKNGVGKGGTVYNLLTDTKVKTIVVAGHGPPETMEVQRFTRNYEDATIYCFEPDVRYWEDLLEMYEKTSVRMFPCALGDKVGEIEFYENMRGGQSSILPWKENSPSLRSSHRERRRYTVHLVTLDAFAELHEIHHIDHLFLDVQGAEHLVFAGAKGLLEKQAISVIVGEATITDIHGDQDSFYKSYRILRDFGYTFVGVYECSQNHWGRILKFDYIFSIPELVERLEHG